jgi:hypothetical protein
MKEMSIRKGIKKFLSSIKVILRYKIQFIKEDIKNINEMGMDYINEKIMISTWKHADVYSEYVKGILLLIAGMSVVMMVASPYGWLYACFPRPFFLPIIWNNFLYQFREIPLILAPPQPEWGIHYVTLFVYSLAGWYGIEKIESYGINKPLQKLGYIFFLTFLTFYVPFELTYITLYDIFHSIPKFGYPAIWAFGWWKGWRFLIDSVIVQDVVLSLFCLGGMYVIIDDLKDTYNIKINFNKTSKKLLLLFFISMSVWVILPVIIDVPEYGTKWFPQTVYVDYGYFEDYNITIPPTGETYGVVEEYWFPNDTVKYANHISKLISVIFMYYTFIPRRIGNAKKEESKL